jgi:hypothetical protein
MNTSSTWVKTANNAYYTWDVSIGKFGGFYYKNSNNEITTEEITLENIGDITECIPTLEYSHINDCIGISITTVELPNIPIGSKFGWDSVTNCWVYFFNNHLKPSYYAKKLERV